MIKMQNNLSSDILIECEINKKYIKTRKPIFWDKTKTQSYQRTPITLYFTFQAHIP